MTSKHRKNKLHKLHKQFDGFCFYCGGHTALPKPYQFPSAHLASKEHIKAQTNGGMSHALLLSCHGCNSGRSHIPFIFFTSLRRLTLQSGDWSPLTFRSRDMFRSVFSELLRIRNYGYYHDQIPKYPWIQRAQSDIRTSREKNAATNEYVEIARTCPVDYLGAIYGRRDCFGFGREPLVDPPPLD